MDYLSYVEINQRNLSIFKYNLIYPSIGYPCNTINYKYKLFSINRDLDRVINENNLFSLTFANCFMKFYIIL